MKNNLRIEINWNSYNTNLLARKLLRHVEKGEIKEMTLTAKKGSLETTILLEILLLEMEIIHELIKYIHRREEMDKQPAAKIYNSLGRNIR